MMRLLSILAGCIAVLFGFVSCGDYRVGWDMIDHIARMDSPLMLASRFPHIPTFERPHIGFVPPQLYVSFPLFYCL